MFTLRCIVPFLKSNALYTCDVPSHTMQTHVRKQVMMLGTRLLLFHIWYGLRTTR
jgi:hypothetical protein